MTRDPLRVGFNLMWLVPGVVGGTEDAAVGLLTAIADRADPSVELVLYAQPAFVEAHPEIASRLTVVTRAVPRGSKALRVGIETAWLPHRFRRDRLDLVHFYGGVIPLGSSIPAVLTLHDVQPLEPTSRRSTPKTRWLSTMIPRSVERAALVLVPSAFVRERMLALLDVEPDKVVVQHHGCAVAADLDAPDVRSRYRLPGPFFLYPAITYPHKNHAVLIEAFAAVRRHHPDVVLVLTGGRGPAEQQVAEAIERHGVGDAVRRVGRVSWPELHAMFREAAALTFPSRYEGFGLPVLQAMSLGCPVIASDAASLPEVVGDGGRLVDPDSVAAWTAAMDRTLDDAPGTAELVERATARASSMTWANLAALMLDVYRAVAIEQEGSA